MAEQGIQNADPFEDYCTSLQTVLTDMNKQYNDSRSRAVQKKRDAVNAMRQVVYNHNENVVLPDSFERFSDLPAITAVLARLNMVSIFLFSLCRY